MKPAKIPKCQRCGNESYNLEQCLTCSRLVCKNCEKSSKRLSEHSRVLICKDDWGSIPKRKTFDHA